MEGHGRLPHHHQQFQQYQHSASINVDASDRFPQWNIQETKEFLVIRAELDQTFMETKRNKLLWEVIATKMKKKGYNRSAEQCKCKWKNLVTRHKGCETMETEAMRQQMPFYNELQAIFAGRIQRMLWAEAGDGASGSKKKATVPLSSEEEDYNEDFTEGAEKGIRISIKKKKSKNSSGNLSSGSNDLKEILEELMKQQMEMEAKWMEAFESREDERRMKEMEWRQTMEALENERRMMEERWREREEERRMREEGRGERRDALITALLNKLRRGDM